MNDDATPDPGAQPPGVSPTDSDSSRRSQDAPRGAPRAESPLWPRDLAERVIEISPNLICVYDLQDRRIVYINPAAREILGHPPEEVVSRGPEFFAGVVHPDDADRLREHHARLASASDDRVREIEYRMKHAEGRWVHVRTRDCAFARDGQGRLRQILGIAEDITERRRSEAALRESNDTWRAIIEQVADVIALTDASGVTTYVSPASERLFGAKPEEMIGRHFKEFLDDSAVSIALASFQAARASGRNAVNLELRMKRKDGSTFIGEMNGSRSDRDSMRSLITIRDITERKRADEALRETARSLREAQRVARVGSFERDFASGRITWSEELCRMNAFDPAGRPILTFEDLEAFYAPESWERLKAAVSAAIEQGAPYQIDLEQVRTDGTRYWTLTRGEPVRDASGRICGLRGTVIDITDRKQADAEREKLQARLSQAEKMESVGRLAGGVAHDFNNMLSVILGNAQLALEAVDPASSLHADLLEIQTAAQRSANLTRQLLAFARKQTVAPDVLDLNAIVGGMLKMLGRLIGEDIDLVWIPGPEVWPVRMDPGQIDQLLTNICVNARDAISDVGTITVETHNARLDEAYCATHPGFTPGDFVRIAISDNGAGMDRETQAHLFEPFFTTKRIGGGTGLGLATVYGIVKQNDGFVNVYSEPGHGTTITIYLPRHVGKVEQFRQKPEVSEDARGHETVLLVEDEPAILKLNRRILDPLGYRVLAAATPGEAIRLAEEHTGEIHLLVTDVVMPEMNGRELARKLLSLYPAMKCLFTSGYTANVIAHRGVLDKDAPFIQKPCTAKDLIAKVREVLDAR